MTENKLICDFVHDFSIIKIKDKYIKIEIGDNYGYIFTFVQQKFKQVSYFD